MRTAGDILRKTRKNKKKKNLELDRRLVMNETPTCRTYNISNRLFERQVGATLALKLCFYSLATVHKCISLTGYLPTVILNFTTY